MMEIHRNQRNGAGWSLRAFRIRIVDGRGHEDRRSKSKYNTAEVQAKSGHSISVFSAEHDPD